MLLESIIAASCIAAGPHISTAACDKAAMAASMQTGSYHLINGVEDYYKRKAETFAGVPLMTVGTISYMGYKIYREQTVAYRIGYGLRLEVGQRTAGMVKEWRF